MTREMYVSSTPHETKVGIVEDDQLAEIFFERENEYTLAGSIYKGRVTRVLPGMQSAFVDIGLERDAFLYVSDFLELADEEEEFEDLQVTRPEVYVTNRAPQEPKVFDFRPAEPAHAPAMEPPSEPDVEADEEPAEGNTQEYAEAEPAANGQRDSEGDRSFRGGRRRRRGRRGRGFPESKFAHPQAGEPEPEREPAPQFGHVPGYQPIILPGESISKYQRGEMHPEPDAVLPQPAPVTDEEVVLPVEDVAPADPPERIQQLAAPRPSEVAGAVLLPGESIAKYRRGESRGESHPITPEQAAEQTVQQEAPIPPARYQRQEPPRRERSEEPPRREPRFAAPIVLPGESISKYRRAAERQATTPVVSEPAQQSPAPTFVIESEPFGEHTGHETHTAASVAAEQEEHAPAPSFHAQPEREQPAPQAEQEQTHRIAQMNVAEVFGGDAADREPGIDPVVQASGEAPSVEHVPEARAEVEAHGEEMHSALEPPATEPARHEPIFTAAGQTLEHEEIEGDEEPELHRATHELAGEEEEDDSDYLELEEETFERGTHRPAETEEPEPAHTPDHRYAEGLTEAIEEADLEEDTTVSAYPGENGAAFDEDEMEFEEEELVGEEAEGEPGEVTRAELRAPTGTAGYQQRTERPTDRFRRDRSRRGGERGRRGTRPRRFEPRQEVKISDLLKEGQEVLIQIAKEPIGKKGARITSHIALPGRFLVYMPTVNHIGVSRKITSDEERQRLKRIMISEREGGHGGFIVRTAAEGVTEDELRADIRFLKNLWSEIKNRAENSKAPALIYHDLNLVERILRDQVTHDFAQVWVDSEQEYERILRFANRFQPSLVRKVKLYTKDTPLFEQFNIQDEINRALKSKVWLKSGGYIVINQTEALVAIDVNTGKYVGKTQRLEDTIVKTNVDAIKEIVRQIRLRDLGGIIVIDFIDMDERRNRQKVMQALDEALRSDRSPSKVLAFNDFGLVAITRKRVKQSLERTLGQPCAYCTGTGMVKSVTTVCNEIYTELRKMARHLEGQDVTLRVNPEVAKALKTDGGRWLQDYEELTGRTIIVKSDPLLHAEQFDIH